MELVELIGPVRFLKICTYVYVNFFFGISVYLNFLIYSETDYLH